MVELYLRSVVRVTDSKHRNYSAPKIQTVVNTCSFFSFGMLNTNYIDSVPTKVKRDFFPFRSCIDLTTSGNALARMKSYAY